MDFTLFLPLFKLLTGQSPRLTTVNTGQPVFRKKPQCRHHHHVRHADTGVAYLDGFSPCEQLCSSSLQPHTAGCSKDTGTPWWCGESSCAVSKCSGGDSSCHRCHSCGSSRPCEQKQCELSELH